MPRYMRAAKWNFADAKKRIQGTLEWRREFKPELISPDEVRGGFNVDIIGVSVIVLECRSKLRTRVARCTYAASAPDSIRRTDRRIFTIV